MSKCAGHVFLAYENCALQSWQCETPTMSMKERFSMVKHMKLRIMRFVRQGTYAACRSRSQEKTFHKVFFA